MFDWSGENRNKSGKNQGIMISCVSGNSVSLLQADTITIWPQMFKSNVKPKQTKHKEVLFNKISQHLVGQYFYILVNTVDIFNHQNFGNNVFFNRFQ